MRIAGEHASGSRDGAGDGLRLAALALFLLLSLALYGGLAVLLGGPPSGWDGWLGFSLPSAALFRAFTGLPAVALSPAGWSAALLVDLILLWALFGGAIVVQRAVTGAMARRRARLLVIAGGAAMLALVVLLVPPLFSSDLYRQAIYGRMVGHGINPYATLAAASGDPLLALATQTRATTTYGPAYTWLSALTTAIFPASPVGVVLGWKTMSALAALGCVALAAPVARTLGDGADAYADEARLWLGWNPLVVIEAAGAGHIESVMMLPALAGLLLLSRRQPARAVALLTLSTLTKWVTGVLLALALLHEIRQAPSRGRRALALRLAGTVAVVVGLLYLPFARGLGSRGGIHTMAIHGAAGFGGAPASGIPQWARMAGFAAVLALAAPFATGNDRARLVSVTTVLILLFWLVVVPWLFPWYFIAPLALAVVLPRGRVGVWLRFAALLGGGGMLYYAKLVPLR